MRQSPALITRLPHFTRTFGISDAPLLFRQPELPGTKRRKVRSTLLSLRGRGSEHRLAAAGVQRSRLLSPKELRQSIYRKTKNKVGAETQNIISP